MTKNRAVKNQKHILKKVINIVRRKGDDWAWINKNFKELDRQRTKKEIRDEQITS